MNFRSLQHCYRRFKSAQSLVKAALLAVALFGLSGAPAYGVPLMELNQNLAGFTHQQPFAPVDLRGHWEAALIAVDEQPNSQFFDPQEVWGWSDGLFSRSAKPVGIVLTSKERYLARLVVSSPGFGTGLNLTFKIPRVDAVHVSYRYGLGPWTSASAGDTLPMVGWPFPDRQPSFDIPLMPGDLSVVVEIAHRGRLDASMQLQDAYSFRVERLNSAVSNGLLMGINLVLMMVGLLTAVVYRRWAFMSISLMTLLMFAVVGASSGLFGVYWFKGSAEFNDQFKFFVNILTAVFFPWITALALSARVHAVWWWRGALAWTVLGTVASWCAMKYSVRDMVLPWVPPIVLGSAALALAMVAYAVVRKQAHAMATLPGIALYFGALLVALSGWGGYFYPDDATMYASLVILLAAMVFLHALIKQHRQGQQLVSRANTVSSRDVLTGLFSRQGFERALAKNLTQMDNQRMRIAFFYIKVSDAPSLQERSGDQSFEVGIVQIAAAISLSVSVADTVGRVAPNAFAVTVLMPHDAGRANAIAQKILARTMAFSSHSVPMAQTARIAMAWLPMFGTLLPDIERRALRTLDKMEDGKRIAWVGGAQAQTEVMAAPEGASSLGSKPRTSSVPDELPSLPGRINRLEREMLGSASQMPKDDEDQPMRVSS